MKRRPEEDGRDKHVCGREALAVRPMCSDRRMQGEKVRRRAAQHRRAPSRGLGGVGEEMQAPPSAARCQRRTASLRVELPSGSGTTGADV